MTTNGSGPTERIERDDLSQVNTPEHLAATAVASGEKLLGRRMTYAEVREMCDFYQKTADALTALAKERV